jgi:four helix bundle protein
MRNFKNLEVWREAIELTKDVYIFKNQLPKSETFGLTSQITRASISISSNLAEGCSRNSEKDFIRFIEYSIGSSFEVENLLILAKELNLVENYDYIPIFTKIEKVQKMTSALKSYYIKVSKDK